MAGDKVEKASRRISAGPKWYRKWQLRYVCRAWAREHDGVLPERALLYRSVLRIPSPVELSRGAANAWAQAESERHEELLYVVDCHTPP